MKKLILIAFLSLMLTSCYMPPRFMQLNPHYNSDYYTVSDTGTNAAQTDITSIIANDINKQIEIALENGNIQVAADVRFTAEFYSKNHNIDQNLFQSLVDRISFALTKIKDRKYDIIYPDISIDEALEKEGLQTNHSTDNKLEEKLLSEYDPGVLIFIEAGKLSTGKVEITAKIILRKNQSELFSKVYKVDAKQQKTSQNVVRTADSGRIRSSFYSYSTPIFAPPYYYWGYPHNNYYWGWGYPYYNPRYSYWRRRPFYSKPYYKRYK
ncbi:MAG: hypothetical protein K8S87_06745 [Planctomycetes bacterium]|nr:hypothetical protein [Planctomycetota bacterium]